MSYDGIFAGTLARALDRELAGGKIERVQQPEPDEILLQIYAGGKRHKLFIGVSAGGACVYRTERSFENPSVAPPFCMLLRKHLQGGRIRSIRQPEAERILHISVESRDEIGYGLHRELIAEVMGKHSNLILLDPASNRIIDCIKRVSIDVNRYRQLLPGLSYTPPPPQSKLNFWTAGAEDMDQCLREKSPGSTSPVMDCIQGFGPTAAQEIQLAGPLGEASHRILALRQSLADGQAPFPAVYTDEKGRPKDIHLFSLGHLYPPEQTLVFDSPSLALDHYLVHRLQSNRLAQRKLALHRSLEAMVDKLLLKKQRLQSDLKEAEGAGDLQLRAELLTASLHRVPRGASAVSLPNYYDGSTLTIQLDPRFSPAKNAQLYYKQFGKAKKSVKEKEAQLVGADQELDYLASVLASLDFVENQEGLEAIRTELSEEGYLRDRSKGGRKKKRPAFRSFRTSSGMEVRVGRNNRENDHLTFSVAQRTDLWFHAKDIPGSHVLLLNRQQVAEEADLLEAAALAARFSRYGNSDRVAVDYTPVKNVKKIAGALPGMVTYTGQKTLYVKPQKPESDET